MESSPEKVDLEENDKISGKGFGVRHVQTCLMFMCVLVGYIMRANMSVAIIAMTDHSNTTNDFQTFKWDKKIQDVILSSFFWGYTIMQVPSGYIAHKYGAKMLLFCAMFLNGLLTLIIPWGSRIGGWQAICACRALQGLTQASLFPCVHTLLSKWIPHSERSRLSNFVFTGTPFGTIVGLPLSSILASTSYGWPSIFYVIGVLGILTGVLWYFCGSDSPTKHPKISKEEKLYIEMSLKGVEADKVLKTPWKSILFSVPVWALMVAHIGCNWGFLTLLVETPSYLKHALGIDMKRSGILSSLPYVAMWLGGIALSFPSDYLVNKKIISATVSRKLFNSIGSCLPAIGLIILGYIPVGSEVLAVSTLTVLVGMSSAMNMGFIMNNIDLAPNFAGTIISITNCVANFIGILAPITVGLILVDEKEISEWRAVFFLTAAVYFFTNLFFVIFGSGKRQSWNDSLKSDINVDENGKTGEEMKVMLKK